MKKYIIFLMMLCWVIFRSPSLCFANRYALVIGNSNYQDAPLRTPVNDTDDMASTLEKLGFSGGKITDVTYRQMEKAIQKFERKISEGDIDIALFYFSGYGVQVDGTNYLIPIGAKINSEDKMSFNAVDVGWVLYKLKNAGSQVNVVILDACRSNPFSKKQGLAPMIAPEGTFIAYAAAPGRLAYDGEGENSLYTKNLLRNIVVPGLEIEKVFKNVRVAVKSETNGRQVPWDSSSLFEDIVLNPQIPEFTPTPEISQLQQLKRELQQRRFEDARLSGERLVVTIPNTVLFGEPDSPTLTSDGKRNLEKIADVLMHYQNIYITVEGYIHRGKIGNNSHYKRITQDQAQEVTNELKRHSVQHDRILDTRGHGKLGHNKDSVLILSFFL